MLEDLDSESIDGEFVAFSCQEAVAALALYVTLDPLLLSAALLLATCRSSCGIVPSTLSQRWEAPLHQRADTLSAVDAQAYHDQESVRLSSPPNSNGNY